MSYPTKITIYHCRCGGIFDDAYVAQICCEPPESEGFKCNECGGVFCDLTAAHECCATEYKK